MKFASIHLTYKGPFPHPPWGVKGGGDLGLNKVKFSRFPPLNVTSLNCPPIITFFAFRERPPPPPPHTHPYVLISKANFSGPPSESFQSFQQWLLGSQLRLIPQAKSSVPPLNPPPPPPHGREIMTGPIICRSIDDFAKIPTAFPVSQ